MKAAYILGALFIFAVLVGCGQTANAPAEVVSEGNGTAATAVPQPTTPATAVPASPTSSPIPPTATIEPTATPAGTETPTPTPTSVWVNPTATVDPAIPAATSAPEGTITQPDYAESECSDKYPCNEDVAAWEARIQVLPGFQVKYYTRVEGQPTSMAFGPDGLLYVAVAEGTIFRIDETGTPKAYVGGYKTPTGIAFHPYNGELYVSSRVIEENIDGESAVSIVNHGRIIEGLPCCYTFFHAANGIAFGPDGYGYVSVGARADHGEILGTNEQDTLHPYEATILRFSPDGQEVEVYARGLRNSYDIAWDGNGDLWATDNDPDFGPPEEVHKVVPGGEHGYPWYDCDVCFQAPPGVEVIPPTYSFMPHASPTGITAYLSGVFPGYYNSMFMVFWSAFPGAQKVIRISPEDGPSDFSLGYAAPIDVTVGPDGNLYVADWATGIIFQISYIGE